jgi:hypothetical protein
MSIPRRRCYGERERQRRTYTTDTPGAVRGTAWGVAADVEGRGCADEAQRWDAWYMGRAGTIRASQRYR